MNSDKTKNETDSILSQNDESRRFKWHEHNFIQIELFLMDTIHI